MGCVYQAINKMNGKSYIGKTIQSLNRRKRKHLLDVQRRSAFYFHRALKKYGIDNFEWVEVFNSNNDNVLCAAEQRFIKEKGTKTPYGYNLTDGGDGVSGFKVSESTKEKLRNRVFSDETKKKISAAKKGHPNTYRETRP